MHMYKVQCYLSVGAFSTSNYLFWDNLLLACILTSVLLLQYLCTAFIFIGMNYWTVGKDYYISAIAGANNGDRVCGKWSMSFLGISIPVTKSWIITEKIVEHYNKT